ncbi:hypothetical protein OAL05_00020 [bacterium]|nr:hypothetical protein [bacterium]
MAYPYSAKEPEASLRICEGYDSERSNVDLHGGLTVQKIEMSTELPIRWPFFRKDASVSKHDKSAPFLPEPQELQ